MPIYMGKNLASSLNFTKPGEQKGLNFTMPGEKGGFNPQPEPPGDRQAKKLGQLSSGPANG
ncbi:MAG: hypothetical protein KIS92_10310 [Planctomycetota bacterium]|nr:hypothetical protein [Planctomycetota bacterium]